MNFMATAIKSLTFQTPTLRLFVALQKEGADSVPLSLLYISLVLYACGV